MNITVEPTTTALTGNIRVPGDKSISHRALFFGALAQGETVIHNFLPAADCLATARCLTALGVQIDGLGSHGPVVITGCGRHELKQPLDILDASNSGTTARLLLGLLAGQPFLTTLTGDHSLCRRPMARVTRPLAQMGARIVGPSGGNLLPLTITGGQLTGGDFTLPVASAQVKSALLLASLYSEEQVVIREPGPSRDHTERLLKAAGIAVTVQSGHIIMPAGPKTLSPLIINVPGDISSAAFLLVAALIVPGSRLTITNVGVNPTRGGLLTALTAMGADITLTNQRWSGLEPVADITVQSGKLTGTSVGGPLIPRLIDEIPALAVAACYAHGQTIIKGAGELRLKESDRLAALASELGALGADIKEFPDGLVISGRPLSGGRVQSHGDHRLAMALAVAALGAKKPIEIVDADCVNVSFPQFFQVLRRLAASG